MHGHSVETLKIVGDPESSRRYYELGVADLKNVDLKNELHNGKTLKPDSTHKASIIYHLPGAYDLNRIVDYPGEAEFDGQIGYGMGSGHGGLFCWDDGRMRGAACAILGNGAFSVENVRSCAEQGAKKIYLITRRKSLPCPRIPCWFCHQGPLPTPAGMLLDFFKPMYELAGIEDPYSFYAVKANEDHTDVSIKQSSRFGIGDVTFLLHGYGLLEYRTDTLARCTKHTLHLTGGEKLENVTHICKALGLIGDPRVDKLHAMTHRIGNMINGDFRRIITADATGMDAKRFETFSAGPGACSWSRQMYWLHQHPYEYKKAQDSGELKLLPVHKMSETQPDQTIYMTTVSYELWVGNFFANAVPGQNIVYGDMPPYRYAITHQMHPTDKYLAYCLADWDRYQNLIRDHYSDNGYGSKPRLPYPYDMNIIKKFFDEYSVRVKYPIRVEGPTDEEKKKCVEDFKGIFKYVNDSMIPVLFKEARIRPSEKDGENPDQDGLAATIYELKEEFKTHNTESSLDFDDTQYEAWKEAVSGEHKYEVDRPFCESKDILTNTDAWMKIIARLEMKQ